MITVAETLDERAHRLAKTQADIVDFLTDSKVSFKDKLLLYIATPQVMFNCYSSVPDFPLFESDYGKIDWRADFPFFRPDSAVNVQGMVKGLLSGNETMFPSYWTDDMMFLFVKDAVEMACHEFDMYNY